MNIQETIKKLNNINFSKVMKLQSVDIDTYSYSDFYSDGEKKGQVRGHDICGFCTSCELKNLHQKEIQKPNGEYDIYRLKLVSHGTHAQNFIDAVRIYDSATDIDTSGWHNEPVLFVAESPSKDYNFYKEVSYSGFQKKVCFEWYWIHEDKNKPIKYVSYPDHFNLQEYGRLFISIINTFKLKNAYFTNLVKCSMNNNKGEFINITNYNEDVIQNCYKTILSEEIEALQPKIIFTIGQNTSAMFRSLYVQSPIPIISIPHPAIRGINNDFFRTIIFWTITKWLFKVEIIKDDYVVEQLRKYMK